MARDSRYDARRAKEFLRDHQPAPGLAYLLSIHVPVTEDTILRELTAVAACPRNGSGGVRELRNLPTYNGRPKYDGGLKMIFDLRKTIQSDDWDRAHRLAHRIGYFCPDISRDVIRAIVTQSEAEAVAMGSYLLGDIPLDEEPEP